MSSIAECLSDKRINTIECVSDDGLISVCDCDDYNDRTIHCFYINNTDLYRYPKFNQAINSNTSSLQDDVPLQIVQDCMNLTGTNYFWDCQTQTNNLRKSTCICFDEERSYYTEFEFVDTKLLYNGLQGMVFAFEKNQDVNRNHSKNLFNQNEQKNLISLIIFIKM